MKIEGENIYLRFIEDTDTDNIIKWRNNSDVSKCFIYQKPFTVKDHKIWLDTMVKTKKVYQFIIYIKKSDVAIGSVYLRDVNSSNKSAEFGIFIGEKKARGKGYGREANDLICNYAFSQLDLEFVFLRVFENNDQAIRSYKSCGFNIDNSREEYVDIDKHKVKVIFMNKYKEGSKENMETTFTDKVLLITGGTGSFGNAVLNKFLDTDIKEIRIFSRDELKQDDMRHKYQANHPEVSNKIKFYIGDVRDKASILNAMHGVDYIFHAAALKQVPSCEFFPIEAVKTNVLGTDNVLSAAIECGVKKAICLSTDKAAYPVNAMGTSKAMMEKVVISKSRTVAPEKTAIMCTRYGNVLASRGSVIPLFIQQIKDNKPLTVTSGSMTRFVMTLEEAVELVIFAFEHGTSGDVLVQKAPACTIEILAQAIKELFDAENEIKIIGIRHGEKMYETLLTNEECANAIDMGKYYRVPCDKRDLNYDKYFVDSIQSSTLTEFNSNNTKLMDVEEVKAKLLTVPLVVEELKKWKNK